MKECFQIDERDHVATLLQDAAAGELLAVRGSNRDASLLCGEAIRAGHKIALQQIPAGSHVLKYGCSIGEAICDVQQGEWVHLHNCRSLHDAGSSSLDLESGERSETRYA